MNKCYRLEVINTSDQFSESLKKIEDAGNISMQVVIKHNGVTWHRMLTVEDPDSKSGEQVRDEITNAGSYLVRSMLSAWAHDDVDLRYSTINGNKKAEVKSE